MPRATASSAASLAGASAPRRRPPLPPFLALASLVVLSGAIGCSRDRMMPAVGPGYEIVVLSPPAHRDLGRTVSEILSAPVRYVKREPRFEVVDDELGDHDFYGKRKLLFAVAPAGDEALRGLMRGAGGTKVPSRFPGLWIVRDPFASGQILFVLTGEKAALEGVLAERPEDLVAVAEEVATTLLGFNLFRSGEVAEGRERMERLWGWGVRLPPDWEVDDRFARDGFVRVWRDGPVAQLFVSWEKGRVERSPAGWLLRRDELTGLYYQGDLVAREVEWIRAETGTTLWGFEGTVLSGHWENEIYVIGGPFESWAFYCEGDDRTYFVDASVYAPDRNKRPLLRIVEAVARTMRCGCLPRGANGPPDPSAEPEAGA